MKRSQRNMTWLSTEVQFYTKFSGLGRPLVIQLEYIGFIWKQALQYVELVWLIWKMFNERCWTHKKSAKTAKNCRCHCQRRSDSPSHKGKIFVQYQKQSSVDSAIITISERRWTHSYQLGGWCWYSNCWSSLGLCIWKKKKMLLYLQKTQIYLHYFCILGTLAWEKPSRRQTKGRAKFKVGQYKKDCRETESCHR